MKHVIYFVVLMTDGQGDQNPGCYGPPDTKPSHLNQLA